MEITPTYPMYLIVGGADQPIISEVDGEDCFVGYATKELAELYIEQVGGGYSAQAFDEAEICSLIRQNRNVPFIAWNNVATPNTFVLLPCDQIAPE